MELAVHIYNNSFTKQQLNQNCLLFGCSVCAFVSSPFILPGVSVSPKIVFSKTFFFLNILIYPMGDNLVFLTRVFDGPEPSYATSFSVLITVVVSRGVQAGGWPLRLLKKCMGVGKRIL